MSNEDRNVYITRQRERYQEFVTRKGRGLLITEVAAYLEVSRDHAIRVLNQRPGQSTGRSGPKLQYTEDLIPVLKKLYFLMRQPCSKRMKIALHGWLPSYEKHFGELSGEQREKLLKISASSIDRLLHRIRAEKGLSTTRAPRGSWYKSVIPIKPKDWDVIAPGHFQCDTVAHCGTSLEGAFGNTITLTDIHTSWTENFAILTKSSARVREGLSDMEKRLCFIIESIKFDSGSEFMNYGVITFLSSSAVREKPIKIYRSRPYQKNDNCYVEQKNFTHVRDLFGYERVENKEVVSLMNEIYSKYWNDLQNYFMPSMKLLRKTRIGARIKKEYDTPKTPYQRLLESSDKESEQMIKLQIKYQSLDPIELQLGLERKLKEYFDLLRQNPHSMAA